MSVPCFKQIQFPEQYDLVERILEKEETVVEDGLERESVYDLFCVGGKRRHLCLFFNMML